MKILFDIQGFHVGGVVSSFLSLARLLEGEGHEIRVVLSSYNGREPMESVAVPRRYVLGWTPFSEIPPRRLALAWFRANAALRWRPFFLLYAPRFPDFDYDCFVLFHGQDLVWRWRRNKPSVLWIHDIWGGRPASRLPKGPVRDAVIRSKREAGAGYDGLVAVTRSSAEAFRDAYGTDRTPAVIGNLIDIARIDRLSLEPQTDIVPDRIPNLLYVGRLSEEKGVDRLLEAARRMREGAPPFRLWIVGSGPDESALQNAVASAGMEESVRFLGVRDNPFPLMKAADLLVLPSRAEGMGMVLWESLLCGTPVLATDCGGTRDALRGGDWGTLVENSTEGIEAGLRAFLETGGAPDPGAARRGIEEADARNRAAAKELFAGLDPARRTVR